MMSSAVSGGLWSVLSQEVFQIASMCRSAPSWGLPAPTKTRPGSPRNSSVVDADRPAQQHYKLWLAGFMGSSHGNALPASH